MEVPCLSLSSLCECSRKKVYYIIPVCSIRGVEKFESGSVDKEVITIGMRGSGATSNTTLVEETTMVSTVARLNPAAHVHIQFWSTCRMLSSASRSCSPIVTGLPRDGSRLDGELDTVQILAFGRSCPLAEIVGGFPWADLFDAWF